MATGKVLLITEPRAPISSDSGFVIYLPVYRAGAAVGTVTERRAALQGFIFANFESDRLHARHSGQASRNLLVDCKVFDGTETDAGAFAF